MIRTRVIPFLTVLLCFVFTMLAATGAAQGADCQAPATACAKR